MKQQQVVLHQESNSEHTVLLTCYLSLKIPCITAYYILKKAPKRLIKHIYFYLFLKETLVCVLMFICCGCRS